MKEPTEVKILCRKILCKNVVKTTIAYEMMAKIELE